MFFADHTNAIEYFAGFFLFSLSFCRYCHMCLKENKFSLSYFRNKMLLWQYAQFAQWPCLINSPVWCHLLFNVWFHFEKLSIMAKIWTRITMILNWWKYISFLTDHPNAVQFFATIFKVLQTGRRRHQTFLAYIPNGNSIFTKFFKTLKIICIYF